LSQLGDELHFVFITSKASIKSFDEKPADATVVSVQECPLAIGATKTDAEKCVRCWHKRDDVGSDAAHPELCERCVINAFGDGEQRQFV